MMFDYQAGEKYKLTLIMVGLAGLMAGIFFTALLMPTPEPIHRHLRPAYMNDPDITGKRAMGVSPGYGAAQAMTPSTPPIKFVDPFAANSLIEKWLPLAWDLSAGTATSSQEQAIEYMTPACAAAYRKNIWTADLSKKIEESGLQSEFQANKISEGEPLADGSIVVFVDGTQTLTIPDKGTSVRQVKLEYLVKQTANGLRIAGISESGKHR